MARDVIREAPVLGHGTGSIRDRFSRGAAGPSGVAEGLSAKPHQQTLEIAMQFGIVGIVTLWAMWLSHLLLFRGCGLPSWVGLVVVAQNIIGSMFSSHLAEFTQAWIYALIVGTAGGMVLQSKAKGEPGRFPPDAPG
jgi:O-antigen ligase